MRVGHGYDVHKLVRNRKLIIGGVSIDFELKRRQRKFKELSDLSCLSIMSLDDYLSIYKEYNLESMSHLLIVVDEFAELKKENPEVIKELISFSRILLILLIVSVALFIAFSYISRIFLNSTVFFGSAKVFLSLMSP